MEPRGIRVYQSLIRPILMLGADRILAILLFMIVGLLVLALPWTKLSMSVAGGLLLIGHPLLVILCKYDPDWRRIVLRLISYQRFYPAAAHPTAYRPIPISVPTVRECQ